MACQYQAGVRKAGFLFSGTGPRGKTAQQLPFNFPSPIPQTKRSPLIPLKHDDAISFQLQRLWTKFYDLIIHMKLLWQYFYMVKCFPV